MFERSVTGLQFSVLKNNPPLTIFGRLVTVIPGVADIWRFNNCI